MRGRILLLASLLIMVPTCGCGYVEGFRKDVYRDHFNDAITKAMQDVPNGSKKAEVDGAGAERTSPTNGSSGQFVGYDRRAAD